MSGIEIYSSLSFISSLEPNFLKTVQIVSRRPFSIKRAWRKRKPVSVSPKSLTPSGTFSWTTFLTPTISAGCKGALKHLTCTLNFGQYIYFEILYPVVISDKDLSLNVSKNIEIDLKIIQLCIIQSIIFIAITKNKYSFQGSHTSGF